jgi:hypothetical protein
MDESGDVWTFRYSLMDGAILAIIKLTGHRSAIAQLPASDRVPNRCESEAPSRTCFLVTRLREWIRLDGGSDALGWNCITDCGTEEYFVFHEGATFDWLSH